VYVTLMTEVTMRSHERDDRASRNARQALEVVGALGLIMLAYLSVGLVLEATTSINVPFVD
jgi:predicted nucleic acid-binding protein